MPTGNLPEHIHPPMSANNIDTSPASSAENAKGRAEADVEQSGRFQLVANFSAIQAIIAVGIPAKSTATKIVKNRRSTTPVSQPGTRVTWVSPGDGLSVRPRLWRRIKRKSQVTMPPRTKEITSPIVQRQIICSLHLSPERLDVLLDHLHSASAA